MSPSTSDANPNRPEDRGAEKRRLRGRLVALALFALSAAPFIAATFAYLYWPPQSRVNYGELIEPRPLSDLPLRRLDGSAFRLSELKGKWIMLQIDSGSCGDSCRLKLLHMRQVRLTQGKEMERVERVWLISDETPLETMLLRAYDGMHFVRAGGSALLGEFPAAAIPASHVYLIDPHRNLMLRFPENADPNLMKKDLARLLRVSRIG